MTDPVDPGTAPEVDWPDWLRPLVERIRGPVDFGFLRPPDNHSGGREAAVLALFGEGPRGPDVLLQQRSADMRTHAGQPAFPGGGIDPTDDGPVAAALREAQEETGLDPTGVEVIATLPKLWLPPSNNVVTPVVGWWRVPSEVRPVDPAEAEAVARVPIADLVDPANRLMVEHWSGAASPGFRVSGMLVWGFTAGILSWLLAEGGWAKDWDQTVVEPRPEQP